MHSLALGTILAAEAAEGGNAAMQFLPLLLIVAVFYLLLIRPQQRKARQHQELVQSIGTGDRVVTIGGIHGTVESIDDDTARIEVAPGTVITVARVALARRIVDADGPGESTGSGLDDEDSSVATDPRDTP